METIEHVVYINDWLNPLEISHWCKMKGLQHGVDYTWKHSQVQLGLFEFKFKQQKWATMVQLKWS